MFGNCYLYYTNSLWLEGFSYDLTKNYKKNIFKIVLVLLLMFAFFTLLYV